MRKQKSMGEYGLDVWFRSTGIGIPRWQRIVDKIIAEHERRKRPKAKRAKRGGKR
jgi:hypothetical protein